MKPTLGRVVHYVLREGRSAGKSRPAFIVEPWAESQDDPAWKGKVNLVVFLDGANDRGAHGEAWVEEGGSPAVYTQMWVGSAEHDEAGAPGTWRWPPRT